MCHFVHLINIMSTHGCDNQKKKKKKGREKEKEKMREGEGEKETMVIWRENAEPYIMVISPE